MPTVFSANSIVFDDGRSKWNWFNEKNGSWYLSLPKIVSKVIECVECDKEAT